MLSCHTSIKERPSNETVAVAAPPTKEPKIKTVFEKKGTGMHKQGDGQNVHTHQDRTPTYTH